VANKRDSSPSSRGSRIPSDVLALRTAGRMAEARASLVRQARDESDPRAKAAQEAELRDLRRWVEPDEEPHLYSMTGFGCSLFGHYQPQGDGTSVAVLWFTLLGLPVLPIAGYLVCGSDESPLGLHTLGRVPLPPSARIARVAIVAAAIVGAVAALAHLGS